MRRLLLAVTVGALVFAFAPVALAHDFTGFGDCDGWTLNLDGDYGATEIYVDGQPVGLNLTYQFPDTSDDESRMFVVFWDKPRNDVTVTHTLYRQLDCEQPPTVTVTCETLTVTAADDVEWEVWIGDGYEEGEGSKTFLAIPDWFYAVVYEDEVIAEGVFEPCDTTTTSPTTTTTVNESTTSTSTSTTDTQPPTTTLPTPTTTPSTTTGPAPTTTAPIGSSTPTELPFTGSEDVPLAVAGLALLGLGAAVLRGRKCDTEEQ